MNASPKSRRLAVAMALALLASTLEAYLPIQTAQAATASQVAVTASVLNVRAGPGTHYAIITKVLRNTRLSVQKQQGSWLQVRLPNGRSGWVSGQYVRPVHPTAPSQGKALQPPAGGTSVTAKTATVTASRLNVRRGPGTQHPVIGSLPQGTRVAVQEQRGEWWRVQAGRLTGWVARQYLRVEGATPSPPASPPVPAPGTQTVAVNTSVLNVRAGPGTHYRVVTQVRRDTRLTVHQRRGEWLLVRLPNGLPGWVFGRYVRPVSTPPAPAPGSPPSQAQPSPPSGRLIPGPPRAPAAPMPQPIGAPGTDPPPAPNDPQAILRGKRIILDPGHGGQDPGAIGRTMGTLEKTVNLQVAQRVKARLEDLGAEVFMTREDDRYPTLADRVAFARQVQGDVFISIHHNSALDQTVRGTMTFYAKDGPSRLLAEAVHEELVRAIGLRDLQVRRANYYVIVNNPYPAILCEIGFLSNPDEERLVRDPEFQARAAQGIVQGLIRYFALSPNSQPDLTRVAYSRTP